MLARRPLYQSTPRGWLAAYRAGRLIQELIVARRWQQVRLLQVDLAFQKWRVARAHKPVDDDPIVVALRADIVARRPTNNLAIAPILEGFFER